jgi:hypothetical protein
LAVDLPSFEPNLTPSGMAFEKKLGNSPRVSKPLSGKQSPRLFGATIEAKTPTSGPYRTIRWAFLASA